MRRAPGPPPALRFQVVSHISSALALNRLNSVLSSGSQVPKDEEEEYLAKWSSK